MYQSPTPTVLVPVVVLALALGAACAPRKVSISAPPPPAAEVDAAPVGVVPWPPVSPWDPRGALGPDETYALDGEVRRLSRDEAAAQGLLDVDLSDAWVPFIFSESDVGSAVVKPNPYRATYLALANDRANPDELLLATPQGELAALSAAGISAVKGAAETPEGQRAIAQAKRVARMQHEHNYLEAFGIPPTLSVLLGRLEEDHARTCFAQLDRDGLAGFSGSVTFQNRDQAKREYVEALADAAWVDKLLAGDTSAADATTGKVQHGLGQNHDPDRDAQLAKLAAGDAKLGARIERYRRGQARLRAVRAVQARLSCEGLLAPRSKLSKVVPGQLDLGTNEALAAWERKNDIFGWGFLGGETTAALLRPPAELHLDTFRRILVERLADAAAILEDGSASASYKDAGGNEHRVPNLLGDYADALLAALHIKTPDDLVAFLRRVGREGLASLHVAFRPPPLPPYYEQPLALSAEIDRGDVWYDFPWDASGKPIEQPRVNYPSLTVFVTWHEQRIPLVHWRTTIGSWRSELSGGKVYYRYKNSDVGPRIWRDIVAAPVWIPPESTPPKDLLVRKVFDRDVGPVTVVNTDIMGPGFQSAYGLVMAIHHRPGPGLSDNQIRTHGSVDYTSIARRFSHGCHRLVNSRAVRMFDFILRRRSFDRLGNQVLNLRRQLTVDDKQYQYVLDTRGYYYRLRQPIPVTVSEGRIMGKLQHPVEVLVRKPGVDYGRADEDAEPSIDP